MACRLFVLTVFLASCTGLTVNPEGRPCSDEEPCGPDTHCDPQTKTCVKGATVDGATGDATTDQPVADAATGDDTAAVDGPAPDVAAPDILQPDVFLIPDAGCPVGYTNCGTACADLSSDINHCGTCNNACPTDAADTCVSGTCVCGNTGAVCPAGMNCVLGVCACVIGGRCTGCCDGQTCVALGPSQSETLCGQNGEACKNCHDGNYCTEETCTAAGACVSVNRPDGTSCSDNEDCSHSDECKAGVCTGVSYSCDDSIYCTSDNCTGDPPPNECTHSIWNGRCLINGDCYHDGEGNPASPCTQVCAVAQSNIAWTAYSGPCVMTVAGDGTSGYLNGAALSARFNEPYGVAAASGKVYVGERVGQRVRLVDAGTVSTIAGTGATGFVNGPVTSAQFNEPLDLVLEAGGGILVADQENHRIRRIASGSVSTFAGTGSAGFLDGAALSAEFYDPTGIAVDTSGAVYVADQDNNRIRVISGGTVSTLAGSGTAGLQDGAASQAQFNSPSAVAVDSAGNVYVADRDNNRIRMISGGQVTTIAGSGTTAGFQDGPAASSVLNHPGGVAVNTAGTIVYFSDSNDRVRTISGGTVSTLAGSGSSGLRDGVASKARFDNPVGLALDGTDIYVADRSNHCIRVIKP